jgi:hypothetical protein
MAIGIKGAQLLLKLQRAGFGGLLDDEPSLLCDHLRSQAIAANRPALAKLAEVLAVVDGFLSSDAIRVGFIEELDRILRLHAKVIIRGSPEESMTHAVALLDAVQRRIKTYDRLKPYE